MDAQMAEREGKNRVDGIRTEAERTVLCPRADILESSSEFFILADLPGVSSDSVDISVDRDVLFVRGTRADDPRTVYERRFTVGQEVDRDGISAELHGGTLHLHLAKAKEVQARKIPVRAG